MMELSGGISTGGTEMCSETALPAQAISSVVPVGEKEVNDQVSTSGPSTSVGVTWKRIWALSGLG